MKAIQLIFLMIVLSVTTGLSCATMAPSEPEIVASTPAVSNQGGIGVATPVESTEPDRAELPVPTPTPEIHHSQSIYSFAPDPSLDHKAFFADVIALVSLRDVRGKTETIPSDAGTAPTYRPVLDFHFDVIEYLQGAGDDEITVQDPETHTYLSPEEARQAAGFEMDNRNTTWDDRVAVVFLYEAEERNRVRVSADPSSPNYGFLILADHPWGHHTIDDNGKAWLPANEYTYDNDEGKHSEAALQKAGEALEFFTSSEPEEGSGLRPVITLGDVRSLIADAEATRQEGAGIEGYEECLTEQLGVESWTRGWEALYGRSYSPNTAEEQFPSGQAAGTPIIEGWMVGGEFGMYWLTGPDAGLFTAGIFDEDGKVIIPDDRYPAAYKLSIEMARPLPSGDYKFVQQKQLPSWVPCNLVVEGPFFEIDIVPPEGTIHEAFFDPVDSEGAIGASGSIGVLKPTTFSVSGTDTAFASLTWKEEVVTLELEQFVALTDHALDFIDIDGSVSLTLSFGEATAAEDSGIFTWTIAESPWQEGDQLLLRLRGSK